MRCYGECEEDEEINWGKDGEDVLHIEEDEELSVRVKVGFNMLDGANEVK